jgi:hypothetical protein
MSCLVYVFPSTTAETEMVVLPPGPATVTGMLCAPLPFTTTLPSTETVTTLLIRSILELSGVTVMV